LWVEIPSNNEQRIGHGTGDALDDAGGKDHFLEDDFLKR
jgi:hypothetical protein